MKQDTAQTSAPEQEIFCGEEGWGPWWIPRAQGHTRSGAVKEIVGLVGERYTDLGVRVQRGTISLTDDGFYFAVAPDGDFRVWEVFQR